jgi:hypothetical protein
MLFTHVNAVVPDTADALDAMTAEKTSGQSSAIPISGSPSADHDRSPYLLIAGKSPRRKA